MRTLVLGSDGFIGKALCAALRAGGHVVNAMDLPEYDLERCEPAFVPATDVVFLLAAKVGVAAVEAAPAETLRTNTLIVQRVLDWLPNKGERLIFASSSEAYAMSVARGLAPVPTPEDIPLCADVAAPRGAYAVSKMFGEAAVRHGHANWTIVRYHNVYGPGMNRCHAIPEMWARRHHSPYLLPGASQTRSFCYIDDAVEATLRLALCPEAKGQVVNVGTAEEVLISDLAHRLGIHQFFARPARPGSPQRRCPDLTRLQLLTSFQSRVALDAGLHRTVQWLKAADPATATSSSS